MKLIDLFSGAGGLAEGFRDNKLYDFVCHVEMDKSATATLQLRDIFYALKLNRKLQIYYSFLKGERTLENLKSLVDSDVLQASINVEINNENLDGIFESIHN